MPSLENFGATVVVGACFIAGVVLALDCLWGTALLGRVKTSADKTALGAGVLLLAFSYAVGILIENTSDYVIGLQADKALLHRVLMPLTPSESELKMNVLFTRIAPSASELTKNVLFTRKNPAYTLTRLGQQVHAAGLFLEYGQADFRQSERGLTVVSVTWDTEKYARDGDLLMSISMDVYYAAKNRVFQVDNYFRELMDIQHRIDFSRSFGVCVGGLGAIILLLTLVGLARPDIARLIGRAFSRAKTKKSQNPPRKADRTRLRRVVVLRALALFVPTLTFYGIALSGYEYEETQFNKRVFGYFLSLKPTRDAAPAAGKSESAGAQTLVWANRRDLEASGVTAVDDRLFIVNDKDNMLYVGNPRVPTQPLTTVEIRGFPKRRAKFEDICFHHESGYFYVVGAYYLSDPNYQKAFRFRLTQEEDFWVTSQVSELVLPQQIASYLSETSSVEGLAVVGPGESPRVFVGIRSKAIGRFQILEFLLRGDRLHLVSSHEVAFSPERSSGGVAYHLSGLTAGAGSNLLVLAASEDDKNGFSGNRVYDVDATRWIQTSVTREFAPSQKAEGIALWSPRRGEQHVVVVFDNDCATTMQPSGILIVPSLASL